ncbi:S24 family peptidase [Chitinophaga rhizophila]|uniref:S24 family peptidase n=1 Tax=Chitinophaga rhizophila TaxID=2866212 RepID=A0ABS7G949_9BACT|nr:S24 family peptidase [Chitinophaga rhizophila]MBW8684187.1 S24 family peptidase [Chitinophaga rhizophila]
MNKYERLKNELEVTGRGKMKAFGSSMLPILKSGTSLTFEKASEYKVGDIVFCKVKGHYIDAHKIIKTDAHKGFLIANNHGFENGWTRTIYGKVVTGEYQHQIIYEASAKKK